MKKGIAGRASAMPFLHLAVAHGGQNGYTERV